MVYGQGKDLQANYRQQSGKGVGLESIYKMQLGLGLAGVGVIGKGIQALGSVASGGDAKGGPDGSPMEGTNSGESQGWLNNTFGEEGQDIKNGLSALKKQAPQSLITAGLGQAFEGGKEALGHVINARKSNYLSQQKDYSNLLNKSSQPIPDNQNTTTIGQSASQAAASNFDLQAGYNPQSETFRSGSGQTITDRNKTFEQHAANALIKDNTLVASKGRKLNYLSFFN